MKRETREKLMLSVLLVWGWCLFLGAVFLYTYDTNQSDKLGLKCEGILLFVVAFSVFLSALVVAEGVRFRKILRRELDQLRREMLRRGRETEGQQYGQDGPDP